MNNEIIKFFKSINFDFKLLEKYDKIYCLVSGGLDSTLLYMTIKSIYPEKIFPVNCWSPYENNKTLDEISEDPKFIEIRPLPKDPLNYGKILKESFMRLPEANELRKQKLYQKKIFPCCYHIKHKVFFKDRAFMTKNHVIISGIKRGDGTQRRIWLTMLSQGREPCNQSNGEPTFFHRHKGGQNYCYPFRDYTKRELPEAIEDEIYKAYPFTEHSGCSICPVLVLFNLKKEGKRYKQSIDYAIKLGVYPFNNQKIL